jgi:hypothetical protein
MKKAESIIAKSGNSLHSKVIVFLRNLGWKVLISPYYSDNQTGKSREMDIIAEKEFLFHKIGESTPGAVIVRLFIECKYIPSETVFWFDSKDSIATENLITRSTPLKPRKENILIEKHHYYKADGVAKLFSNSSEPNRNTEKEPFFSALNQILNATLYYRNRSFLLPEDNGHMYSSLKYVHYPIIVLNDFSNIYNINIGDSECKHTESESFISEINYSFLNLSGSPTSEYFLIDVVDFLKFGDYLSYIEKEEVLAMQSMLEH